jgi:hypothetical protein
VVYSNQLAESKLVAQHYAHKRGVPASQVIGLALPVTEVMTRAEFRRQRQEPLFG